MREPVRSGSAPAIPSGLTQSYVVRPGDSAHVCEAYVSDGTIKGITHAELCRTAANVLNLILNL